MEAAHKLESLDTTIQRLKKAGGGGGEKGFLRDFGLSFLINFPTLPPPPLLTPQELKERNEALSTREKRILDLKGKNQELDKYRWGGGCEVDMWGLTESQLRAIVGPITSTLQIRD